jgi:hypothetical protein
MKTNSKIILAFLFLNLIFLNTKAQNTVITDSATYLPQSSAMLDVQSINKGMLVPRMTTAQRTIVSNPATGLLVFDTDSVCFYFYNGISWVNLTSGNAIFNVVNNTGDTFFAVYPQGVRINVYDDPLAKAVSKKGRFAVGGYKPSKGGLTNNFLLVNADSTRIYTTDTIKGFGIQNLSGLNKTSYMQLTPKNYFIGHEAGKSITSGKFNSFMGYQSGKMDTSGSYNVFLGHQAGLNNLGGAYSPWMDASNEGSFNVFIGYQSGFNNYGGLNGNGSFNVFLGFQTGYSNTTGNSNTACGSYALYYNTGGVQNTAIGKDALPLNTTGCYNTANGYHTLYNNTTGFRNTASGINALMYNITGGENTALGYNAYAFAYVPGADYNNSTALGANSNITASNQVRIGDAFVTSIGGQVGWSTLSDVRFKKEIKESEQGLNFF